MWVQKSFEVQSCDYETVPDGGTRVSQSAGQGFWGGLDWAALLPVAPLLHGADGLQYQTLLLRNRNIEASANDNLPLTCSAWVSCGLAPGVWVTPGGEMTPGYLMLGGQRSSPGLRRPYWTSCTGAQWVVAEKGTNLFQAMSISWSFKAPQRRIWLLTWIEILVAGGHSMCSESPSHAALWRVESELESSARGSRRSIWKISDLIHLLQSLNKRFNVSLNSANKAFYSGTRPN